MKQLVLVGAGHAHALVLEARAAGRLMQPRVMVVSPEAHAAYSGMVPGWLAGEHNWADCAIDFEALADRAGARFVKGAVAGVDRAARQIRLRSGQALPYDLLSINVGSTVDVPAGSGVRVLPTRPLMALRSAWHALLEDAMGWPAGTRRRLVVVGGGAAACECALAVQRRLTAVAGQVEWRFTLATRGEHVLPNGSSIGARALVASLHAHGIDLRTRFDATGTLDDSVVSASGERLGADIALWATGAQAFDWPRTSGLPVDASGFIRVTPTLQVVDDPALFAAGDCAALGESVPKAGVFSVRMGEVLACNLQAAVEGHGMRAYRPQRRHLALIRTGQREAIATWGPLAATGAWAWAWKRRIDFAFVRRFARGPATLFP